jgi:hypothetical protein
MPSTMNPTCPRSSKAYKNVTGRVWLQDPYLSEAALKARLLAYKPQAGNTASEHAGLN